MMITGSKGIISSFLLVFLAQEIQFALLDFNFKLLAVDYLEGSGACDLPSGMMRDLLAFVLFVAFALEAQFPLRLALLAIHLDPPL